MSPDAIDQYTKDVTELLNSDAKQRVDPAWNIMPYDPIDIVYEDDKTPQPFTIVAAWVWTEFARLQREPWEAMQKGFMLAANMAYPEAKVVRLDLPDMIAKRPGHDDGSWRIIPQMFLQAFAKARRSVRGPMACLDMDVVCNRPCNPFESEFDVGLTTSKEMWPMMPFNGGVHFYHDTPGAQLYLDMVMELTCSWPANSDPWYSSQLAQMQAYLHLRDRVKFKFFPHDLYNYTPEVYHPTDAYFVHLKGLHRKGLHRDYVLALLEKHEAAPKPEQIVVAK